MSVINLHTLDLVDIEDMPRSRSEARSLAIEWQNCIARDGASYGELIDAQEFFKNLGDIYDLNEEFTENGIF